MSYLTGRLADFSTSLEFEDLPADVVDEAKRGLVDTIGAILVGSQDRATAILREVAGGEGLAGPATVLGTGWTAPVPQAALLNGYAAHVLDFDDTQHRVGTHMSAPVIAAALALAETKHVSGKDLLTSYVSGFEVGCRLGRADLFARYLGRIGIHATSYLGHFGAATAAGRLLELDAQRMRRTWGITAGYASGITRSFGTMGKGQNSGNAAQNGVFAALLAERGFTGPEDIFDGDRGSIFTVFGAKVDPETVIDCMGEEFEMSFVTRKPFACAGWRNPIVEAAILLSTTHDLHADDVASITVRAATHLDHLPNYAVPRIGLEAKFSAQYAAGIGVVDRAGGVHQFSDERVADRSLSDLCRRIELVFDPELGPYQIRVEIRTTDGRELSHFVPDQKGEYTNPLTWDELVAKFESNAGSVLPPPRVERLISELGDLENLDDVGELGRLCRCHDAQYLS